MRVFVALDIPQNVKEKIKRVQDKLPNFQGRKTTAENLHLTLKFLGEIDASNVEVVKEKLNAIKLNSFETEIKEIGYFDNYGKMIIWLSMTNCGELQQRIDNSLRDLFTPENRFMSHLTIARTKKINNKKDFLDKLEKIKLDQIEFIVKEFKLKSSTLTKKGPVYRDLEVYSLR